jgi:hypothetical protein
MLEIPGADAKAYYSDNGVTLDAGGRAAVKVSGLAAQDLYDRRLKITAQNSEPLVVDLNALSRPQNLRTRKMF